MTTTAVIWVTVAALAFLAAFIFTAHEAQYSAAPVNTTPIIGIGLGALAPVVLRLVAPTAPYWTWLVVGLLAFPAYVAAEHIWATFGPNRPDRPTPPIGVCRRCHADLWDWSGRHRYTDDDASYLCPPEHWQPGQHRLHQLRTAPADPIPATPRRQP